MIIYIIIYDPDGSDGIRRRGPHRVQWGGWGSAYLSANRFATGVGRYIRVSCAHACKFPAVLSFAGFRADCYNKLTTSSYEIPVSRFGIIYNTTIILLYNIPPI